MILKKRMELSKWPDKELNELVDKYLKDEKEILEDNPDYSGYVITFKELNKLMNYINGITKEEDGKRNKRSISPNRPGKNVEIRMDVSMAAREIMEFLKTIDQELYLYALGLFLGTRDDTIRVYDYYEGEKRKEVLQRESCNLARGKNTDTYVVLGKQLDRDTSDRLKRIAGSDKCTIAEAMIMMHEIAHSFDRNRERKRRDLENPSKRKMHPQMTVFYLAETTAVFFETAFGLYLAEKYPEYRGMIEDEMKHRAVTSAASSEKTRIKASLVSVKEDKGYVPDNFIAFIKSPETAPEIKKDLLKESSFILSRKYALAHLFIPTMIKVYFEDREKGKERVLRYLECCRNNDFDGALAAFGMDLKDKDNLNNMLENFREYFIRYRHLEKAPRKEDERDI